MSSIPLDEQPAEPVSVLVPVRNEEVHIEACLESLMQQDIASELHEIIVIDNHSTDRTAELIENYTSHKIRLLTLQDHLPAGQAYKKEAIDHGIQICKYPWILTTDGDTLADPKWIREMAVARQRCEADMMISLVYSRDRRSLLTSYQTLDLAGLAVATGAGLSSGLLISGNGANLLFSKEGYQRVGGLTGHAHIRSGDDLFLIQKFYQDPGLRVAMVKSKSTSVITNPRPSWKAFFSQRLRWASKSQHLPHVGTKSISYLVFLNSLLLLLHLPLTAIWGQVMITVFAIHILLKSVSDFYLLQGGLDFFKLRLDPIQWLVSILINPVYVVMTGISVILGIRPLWKGRRV